MLPFDTAAGRRFAAAKVDLYQLGTLIGDADLQIASIALVHNLTVVTANTRHFERLPELSVENWLV